MPAGSSIALRIGVNVGDVIIDGDDLYGDGVNVAARLEKLADPGGICISGMVFDQVKGKLDAGFQYFGTHQVRNIVDPVRTYRVASVSVSSRPTGHVPAPAKPSIAVLPFDNMSDDHAQEYFSDGISEDLTTALSRFEWLFVIARNAAFTYKGKAVDVRQIGRELGVRYILEGSVRRAGDRVRVNAQLIETELVRHVWAQRDDRRMDDLFELQDDIVEHCDSRRAGNNSRGDRTVAGNYPDDLDAWDHYLRALAAYRRMSKQDMDAAVADLERAIGIDPEFANAYAARPVPRSCGNARLDSPGASRIRGSPTQGRAGGSPRAHQPGSQSIAGVRAGDDRARRAGHTGGAARDRPQSQFCRGLCGPGSCARFCGELEAGMASCHRAERGSPRGSRGTWLYDAMGHGYFFLGDYEKAIEVSKKGLHQDPALIGGFVTLACVYAQLGRDKEANHYVEELLRLIPRYSLRALRKNPMFVTPDLIEKLIESMRLAGLPE